MQSGQKQVVLGKGEKERRERRKEKRKRKKKEEKKEKEEKEKEKERRKKGGGGRKQIKKQNKTKTKTKTKTNKKRTTGEYLLILCTLSPLASPGSCPSSWSSGGGACCADFQVLAAGELLCLLPGAGLSGGLFTP